MDREQVNSSAIGAVGFSLSFKIETLSALVDLPGTLEIEFARGGVWQYLGVPTSVYQALLDAPSPGAYFNAEIRDRYGSYQA